ncbi:hypothetical protein APHCRT_1497 [Anaplasma phagocytophilum str. CRT53-1]|uniref:Uncharacterized protein n=3 Tax=Anaplasma phagocytophilum TaxID=948 RepID=A0A0F3NJ62_ANAPH|nr:hypothetical protein APHNP_0926 [Anaplasma phagocytophilum str. ApNP]KJV80805.1 hypothetical protein APHCRT_1497 [Anaplasma phagocytophilum str. CRT53-1]
MAVTITCNVPKPKTCIRMADSRSKVNSIPIKKRRNTTPNSAKLLIIDEDSTSCSPCVPIAAPATKYPSTGLIRNFQNSTTTTTAAANSTMTSNR